MTTPKRKKKKSKQSTLPPFLIPAAIALVLLVLILLIGNRTTEPALTTAPTEVTVEVNPYLPGDFVYENGYLSCSVADAALGIDVSEHQQAVDWDQVRNAGMEFVMIRAGYRGYTEGELYEDSMFRSHLAGAKDAGLKVGVYFFSQATTPEEAEEEAAFVLKLLKKTDLDLPVVYDWEYVSTDARTAAMDRRTLTDCAIAFCEAIEDAGFDPMVYFNPDLARNMFLLEELTAYDFWLAMYDDQMDFPFRVDLWQYTHTGSVPGIEGDVDVNLYLP